MERVASEATEGRTADQGTGLHVMLDGMTTAFLQRCLLSAECGNLLNNGNGEDET